MIGHLALVLPPSVVHLQTWVTIGWVDSQHHTLCPLLRLLFKVDQGHESCQGRGVQTRYLPGW